MSKLKINKPKGTKGTPTNQKKPTGNLSTSTDTDKNTASLNFKISEDFQLRFKMAAIRNKMKLNEFLKFLLDEYENK